MMDLRVAFHTLGCKLNQLETESVADSFAGAHAQLLPFDGKLDTADLYVINTCTVTGKAEQKARRIIRQALAQNPDAVVLVTGCYAQVDGDALAALDHRVVVIPGSEKASLLGLPEFLGESWQGHGDLLYAVQEWRLTRAGFSQKNDAAEGAASSAAEGAAAGAASSAAFAFRPESFAFHSRPALKIQDGCNNRCAYCRVCLARGPSVSLPVAEAVARAQALEAAGKAEIVLTGVNLSHYQDGGLDFSGLLRLLHAETSRIAFRISSYEPDRVDDDFLQAFSLSRVRPHIHLSLQSGSDAVLQRMARPYSAEGARRAVAALRAVKADPFVGVDIIVGFPGETDEEFDATLALCNDMRCAWIHAFPFSPRPGTRAFDMRPRVAQRVAGERAALLLALARAGKTAYAARQAGRSLDVVLEQRPPVSALPRAASGIISGAAPIPGPASGVGTSENYLKIKVVGLPESFRAGQSVSVRVLDLPPDEAGIDAMASV